MPKKTGDKVNRGGTYKCKLCKHRQEFRRDRRFAKCANCRQETTWKLVSPKE